MAAIALLIARWRSRTSPLCRALPTPPMRRGWAGSCPASAAWLEPIAAAGRRWKPSPCLPSYGDGDRQVRL